MSGGSDSNIEIIRIQDLEIGEDLTNDIQIHKETLNTLYFMQRRGKLGESLEEAYRPRFDIKMDVNNPDFDPNDESSTAPETIEVGVNYSIVGAYSPASLYEPEEIPEIEITEIVDLETGQDLTNDSEIHTQVYNALEEEHAKDFRLTKQEYNRKYNDDFDFDESIDRVKKLSGLK